MANLFWVGGTHTYDGVTNVFATTTGGSATVAATTSSDDVFFDGNSGAGTATWSIAASMRSLQSANSSIATFVHNISTAITIGDSTNPANNIALDLSGFTTYTKGNATSSSFFFSSTSSTQVTINYGGKAPGNQTWTGAGGSWKIIGTVATNNSAAWTYTTATGATLDFNGITANIGSMNLSNAIARTVSFGAANITFASSGNALNGSAATSALTITANTATFTFTSGAATLLFGNGTNWNGATFVMNAAGTNTINTNTQGSTIGTFTRTGAASGTYALNLAGNGTLTIANTNGFNVNGMAGNLVSIQSSAPGSQRTISSSVAQTLTYVKLQDSVATGGGNFIAQGSQDLGNNSGWDFERFPSGPRTLVSARPNGGYVSLGTLVNNRITTPDSVSNQLVSGADIRMYLRMATWDPGATRTFVCQDATGSRSWGFRQTNGNKPNWFTTHDGSTVNSNTASAALPFPDGTWGWIRVTWQSSDGKIQFFSSYNGVTWVQVGINRTGLLTTIFDGTPAISIGGTSDGSSPLQADISYVEIRSSPNGTIVGSFDAQYMGSTTMTDTQGNVWTLQNTVTLVLPTRTVAGARSVIGT